MNVSICTFVYTNILGKRGLKSKMILQLCYMNLLAEASNSGNDNYAQIAINKKFLVSLLQLFVLLHFLNFTFGVGEQTSVHSSSVSDPSTSLFEQCSFWGSWKHRGETVKVKPAPGASWRSRVSDRRCGLFSSAGCPQVCAPSRTRQWWTAVPLGVEIRVLFRQGFSLGAFLAFATVCAVCVCVAGAVSECKDSPHRESGRWPPGSAEVPAGGAVPPGRAVQTQQPCSVKASLSSDLCSGLGPDVPDASAGSAQGDCCCPSRVPASTGCG